jgi:hypothetical protein
MITSMPPGPRLPSSQETNGGAAGSVASFSQALRKENLSFLQISSIG